MNLLEDEAVFKTIQGMAARFSPHPADQEDLLQECRVCLWRTGWDKPGQTRSWYLQNCKFHLQHYLSAGRSVDSPKRAHHLDRLSLEIRDDRSLNHYHTGPIVFESVSALDMLSTLARHLNRKESAVLQGLAIGLKLREIAAHLKLSYPTALKYRRKIAALAVKLGLHEPDHKPGKKYRAKLNGHPTGRPAIR